MTTLTLALVGKLCRTFLQTSEVAVAIYYAAPWAEGGSPREVEDVRPAPQDHCRPILA